jgi:hypothetical protein
VILTVDSVLLLPKSFHQGLLCPVLWRTSSAYSAACKHCGVSIMVKDKLHAASCNARDHLDRKETKALETIMVPSVWYMHMVGRCMA